MAEAIRSIQQSPDLQKWYIDKLQGFLLRIGKSFDWWVGASYRRNESEIVGDAKPEQDLNKVIRRVKRYWDEQIDEFTNETANQFARKVNNQVKNTMLIALRSNGTPRTLNETSEVVTAFQATVRANASLIRSLTEDYLMKAEDIIWRGVQYGRDLQFIRQNLVKELNIGERRAANIARDQAHKASQALVEARAESIGATEAYWQHNVGGSRTFRDDHVEMDGMRFKIAEGCPNPVTGEFDHAGEKPFCKCTIRVIIPGYDE